MAARKSALKQLLALLLLGICSSEQAFAVVDLTKSSLTTRIAAQVCSGLFNRVSCLSADICAARIDDSLVNSLYLP